MLDNDMEEFVEMVKGLNSTIESDGISDEDVSELNDWMNSVGDILEKATDILELMLEDADYEVDLGEMDLYETALSMKTVIGKSEGGLTYENLSFITKTFKALCDKIGVDISAYINALKRINELNVKYAETEEDRIYYQKALKCF